MVIEREVTHKAAEYNRLMDALGPIAPGIGVDLLIYALREFARRRQVAGTILLRAHQEGKVMHDSLSLRRKADAYGSYFSTWSPM